MIRSFKYRLWTNVNQERELSIMLETHRRLYNSCLEKRKTSYETVKISITYNKQSAWFTQEKKNNPWFARINHSSAQCTMQRLDKAFKAFFRRVKAGEIPGYPRFKGFDFFNSIEFHNRDGIHLIGNKLRIQFIGNIRVKLHRPVEGTIKRVIIKREAGKWYVVFACELPEVVIQPSEKPPVGIDVGLESFLTTSEGTKEKNPRYLKKSLPKLRIAGRSVSRKKKKGKNRRKAVQVLQKIHTKIKNQRREHHFQVACGLILAYGMIAVESLNIKKMIETGRFSRAISDVAWGSFLNILKHKAEKAGVEFVEVDPAYTSQDCSRCGERVQKDLSVRKHICPKCGLCIHRDHNGALNILARGLGRTDPVGVNVDQQIKRPPRSHPFQGVE